MVRFEIIRVVQFDLINFKNLLIFLLLLDSGLLRFDILSS